MSEPSLSLAADRTRWLPYPSSCARRLLGLFTAALLAGCSAAGATPTSHQTASSVPSASVPTASAVAPSPTPEASVLPEPSIVARKLAAVSRSGIGTSGIMVLADDGTKLAARRADEPMAPASTMKVLTSLAALDTLGADHRFSTRVVGAGKQVVLVGGGDPLLTDKQSKSSAKPASLQALARATAAALSASGVKRVRLGYDDSLFSGPDFNPHWKSTWRSWVARVSPLLIGEGRFNIWQADATPARTAALAFAKRLKASGITVTRVAAAKAPAGGRQLASVDSAPLATVVRRTLRYSDNLAAEVIARHLAVAAGEKGSFTSASTALKRWLIGKGLWADGMRIVDGSGLALSARATPRVLAKAILLALDDDRLAAVASGLPVAGRTGTLKDRFDDKQEAVGRGNVHAKTGTLIGVAALAGYLTTADGDRLVFAAVSNHARGRTTAYNWLDRSAAALVRCGCR